MKFYYNTNFTPSNNPKDLDPSFKTDLDFGIVLEGKNFRLITEEIRYFVHILLPVTNSHYPGNPYIFLALTEKILMNLD